MANNIMLIPEAAICWWKAWKVLKSLSICIIASCTLPAYSAKLESFQPHVVFWNQHLHAESAMKPAILAPRSLANSRYDVQFPCSTVCYANYINQFDPKAIPRRSVWVKLESPWWRRLALCLRWLKNRFALACRLMFCASSSTETGSFNVHIACPRRKTCMTTGKA
jgi:hypothetical protein